VIFKKMTHYFGSLAKLTIGILGLSFKADTDDVRESPSITLVLDLIAEGVNVRIYDPIAMENAKKNLPSTSLLTWCQNEMDVAEDANALALMTEWKQFRFLDFPAILSKMKGRAFFDGRNQYNAQEMTKYGFDYFSIGKMPSYAEECLNSHLNTEVMCEPY
jgi:UDPglucose 6-dehydrogenase